MFGHLDSRTVEEQAMGASAHPHLAGCVRCAAKVQRARARRTLLSGLRVPEWSEEAAARVEKSLFSRSHLPVRPAAPRWRYWAVGMALASVWALYLWWPAVSPSPPAPTPVAMDWGPPSTARATLVQGEAQWRPDARSAWQVLVVGAELSEGAQLRTGQGRLRLALTPGRAVVLEPEAVLALSTLRALRTELKLDRGEVVQRLTPLGVKEQFVLQVGPRWVQVVGTAFSVTRLAAEVQVAVEHGVVAVSDEATFRRSLQVVGPASLRWEDGQALEEASLASLAAAENARLRARPGFSWAVTPEESWSRLQVGELPAEAKIQLDESGWGPVPLEGLFAPGRYRVRLQVPGQPEREVWVKVQGEFTPVEWPTQTPLRAPVPLSEEALVQVLQGAARTLRPAAQLCYEKALKNDPSAGGEVILSLDLLEDGQVRAVQVRGGRLSASTEDCLSRAARALKLPAIGTRQEVEIPLRLVSH